MAPQGELCLMPQYHLEMELAEPRVVGETRFLRRCVAGILNGHEILAEHDAPLQFAGPRVGTFREVDDAALVPVPMPIVLRHVGGGKRVALAIFRQRLVGGRILAHERELASAGNEREAMGRLLLELGFSLPADAHIVGGGVDHTTQEHALPATPDDGSGVQRVGIPSAAIIAMHAGGIRKAEHQGQLLGSFDLSHNRVGIGQTSRLHLVGDTAVGKTALHETIPELERLVDILYVGCRALRNVEADGAQVQAVGIHTVVVGGIFLAPIFFYLHGIRLLAAAPEVVEAQRLLGGQLLLVGKRVPAPVAHGAQGNAVAVGLGECLQAGGVDGEGKMAVAHRERGQRVDGVDVRVVAGEHLPTVYFGQADHRKEDGNEKKQLFHILSRCAYYSRKDTTFYPQSAHFKQKKCNFDALLQYSPAW